MKISTKSICLVMILAAYGFTAAADERLIEQMEQLRSGLSIRDEGRVELTLRIADMHFYEAVEKAKQSDLSSDPSVAAKLAKLAAGHRVRALELYREGLTAQSPEDLRVKIQFQMAQLLGGLGRKGESAPLWKSLAEQNLEPKIRSEALMRLAQAAEEAGSSKDRAAAETYYRAALKYCQAHDVCSFVRYRLAWLLKGQDKVDEAIAEIRQSLWDSNGSVQEEVLRDLLVFYAAKPGNGSEALAAVDELAQKTGRAQLVQQLADNFYSAGNKAAAVSALRLVEDRSPSLANQLRLMEEYYATRSWDAFRSMMQKAEKSVEAGAKPDENGEKLLLRLVIQLDGERETQKQYSAEFQKAAMLYLALFPKNEASFRMMESWLAAEADSEAKKAQLEVWLAGAEYGLDQKKEIRLREVRAALAQETKDHAVLRAEMAALLPLYSTEDKKREAEYLLAKSYYETKELDRSLDLFRKLAQPVEGGKPDKFALLSQNLALDVLNQKAAYAEIAAQAEIWLKNAAIQKDPSLAADLKHMQEVADQARFEGAVKMGAKPEALATFSAFCLDGKIAEKACSNARTLAAQLDDRPTLIRILEKQGAEKELMQELEATAHFGRAAQLREKELEFPKGKWSGTEAIKISLLYELGGRFADRDRWLKALSARYKKHAIDIDEALLYQTLLDAGLLESSALALKWSDSMRAKVAHQLELAGRGSKETRRLLLASKTEVGPAWAYYVEKELHELDIVQRKIGFYGKNSKRNFQKRLDRVKAADQFASLYLEGASLETRVGLLARMHSIYADLVQEIQGAPVPENVDEATKAQIAASLAEMAKPFSERAQEFSRLANEQIARLEPVESRAEKLSLLDRTASREALAFSRQMPRAEPAPPWNTDSVAAHLRALHTDPEATSALSELKDYFAKIRQVRLSSYFEGRIRSAEKGNL